MQLPDALFMLGRETYMLNIVVFLFYGGEIPIGRKKIQFPLAVEDTGSGAYIRYTGLKNRRAKGISAVFLPWVMEAKHMMSRRERRMEGGAAD